MNNFFLHTIITKVPTTAKYPLPQRRQIWRKQFLEASDWFKTYNRGKIFNFVSKQVQHSINLDNAKNFLEGKGYFAANGTITQQQPRCSAGSMYQHCEFLSDLEKYFSCCEFEFAGVLRSNLVVQVC